MGFPFGRFFDQKRRCDITVTSQTLDWSETAVRAKRRRSSDCVTHDQRAVIGQILGGGPLAFGLGRLDQHLLELRQRL